MKYLARPAADMLLVLVAGSGTKPDAALKNAATAVEFRSLGDERARRSGSCAGRPSSA